MNIISPFNLNMKNNHLCESSNLNLVGYCDCLSWQLSNCLLWWRSSLNFKFDSCLVVFCQELSILLVDADLINCDLISLVRGTCASPISVLADLILGKLPKTIELDGGSWQCYVKIFEPISRGEDQGVSWWYGMQTTSTLHYLNCCFKSIVLGQSVTVILSYLPDFW